MLILQGSDIQYGAPYRPDVGEAFCSFAHELDPDLVVVAGDLTQRAKASEYRAVRAFLDALPDKPVVVTPGNHDVPLYRIWERLFAPYRNWKRYIAPELDSVTSTRLATVVALNSSAPRRAIVAGHVSTEQVAYARKAFATAPSDHFRILVVHHHFIATEDRLGGTPLSNAAELLQDFEEMGVDLILGGHVHQTHLTTSRDLVPGPADEPGIALVACGTTASSRGRGPEAGHNTLNVVRLDERSVMVTPYRFDEDSRAFVAQGKQEFLRRTSPSGAQAADGGEG